MSFHPGVVRSNFGAGRLTRFFYKYAPGLVTPEAAGELLVWLSTAPTAELTDGGYYVGRKPTRPAAHARVWHTLVHFLTSQIKWNNSHHISQANDLWNSNMVLLVFFTITHHRNIIE